MMAMTVQMDLDDAHEGQGPPPKALMSGLLKRIEAQVAKTCDTDEGECPLLPQPDLPAGLS